MIEIGQWKTEWGDGLDEAVVCKKDEENDRFNIDSKK